MSEDKPADTAETAPAEVNAIPNGKGHDPGEEISAKTPPAEGGGKWVQSSLTQMYLLYF